VTVYAGSFVFTLFSTCLNLISLNRLDWIVYKAPPAVSPAIRTLWGLFETCDFGPNGQVECRDFPREGLDCRGSDAERAGWHKPFSFCDHWRTAGYAAQLAAVFGCAALISHIIIVSRGRHFRNHGWKVLSGFILANATCLIITTAYVVRLMHTHPHVFTHGSRVITAFILAQVAWGTDVLLFGSLVSAGIIHARNGSPDGYREIPGTSKSRRSRRWSNDTADN